MKIETLKNYTVDYGIITDSECGMFKVSGMLANILLEDYEDGCTGTLYLLMDGPVVAGATRSEKVVEDWKSTYPSLRTETTKSETAKPETKPDPKTETIEPEESNPVLDWFAKKDASRYKKNDKRVESVPETAVALNSTSRRYEIKSGSVYRYLKLKSGGYQQQLFGNAAFAPEFVKEALSV